MSDISGQRPRPGGRGLTMRLQGSGLSSKDRVRSVGRVFGRGRLDALRGLAFSRTQRGVLGFHANPFRPGQIIRGNARGVVRPIQRGPIAENLRAGGVQVCLETYFIFGRSLMARLRRGRSGYSDCQSSLSALRTNRRIPRYLGNRGQGLGLLFLRPSN